MVESSYTVEQEKIALEVLSKNKQEFYEILKVNRSADDQEIKKSYRKLAIKLHPDKNPHPRASEAFKVINRAFEVLSDAEKRQMYDRLGRDPDDRSMPSGSSSSYQAGFPQEAFFGRRHADPREDIFDYLFNMGGGSPFGGPFGNHPFGSPFMNGGGASTFTFGGPGGFRVYTNTPRHAQQRQRQRQQQQQQEGDREQDVNQSIRVLLPLLVLFLVPLLERFVFG
ncbi:hypothetical protein HG535_0D01380 [Zygotorulaspora mrakii]|uniref:J domain-containing protein n=1 Tax=Zygotorulaspora mrakii TaxID=42260 RepID=A0A7H9B1C6_ZYGMR|nr:uncharacterized protein HG535_0D01380 [Zygotorulaspora mrakii]QLG72430.1 hypothetical protein HG535_0D01380 [Zygotorulaspora mrakii]